MDSQAAPHPALEAIFAGFDTAGARWVVLRGDVTLGDPEGDIDLFIGAADLGRVRSILKDLGFAEVPGRGYGTHRFFLSHHRPTGRWVKVDLLTELAFGRDFSLSTGAEDACLERRRRVGSVAVLAEPDAFWVDLLHGLLDRTVIVPGPGTPGTPAGVIASDSPLAAVIDAACPPGWSAARLARCAGDGDWDALRAVAPPLAASWRRRQGLAGAGRRARLRLRRGRDRVLRRCFRPPVWTAYLHDRTVT